MKRVTRAIILLLTAFIAASCSNKQPVRSIYYWETNLNIDSTEKDFLSTHNIKRIYCRYFDVVPDANGAPQPNATLSFDSKFPEGMEIISVVYILNDCMQTPDNDLARKIFTRILKINETNDIHGVKEIQIDCDWSASTRQNFFNFIETMYKLCHDNGLKLSATIRLHQLSQQPPHVDNGVLMMYNTGDPTNISEEKPILDIKDVMPYLRYLKSYDLPLSTAYPLFNWKILFRGKKFKEIIHEDDDIHVFAGDTLVRREPTLDDILKAEQAVEKYRPDANEEVILYHLNDNNITRFNTNDYERIYEVR